MKTIKSNTTNIIVINKSKFICLLIKVNSTDEVKIYLDKIKNEYENATHYCYSFIIDNIKRFNDDGEPNGTAGMPILNVLENNNLNHILCVVVRYFGGIKLGAGGLVRAYSNSVSKALENSQIIDLEKGYIIKISFPYDNIKDIDYLLKEQEIIDKDFFDNIYYTFKIKEKDYILLKEKINKYTLNLNIIDDIYV